MTHITGVNVVLRNLRHIKHLKTQSSLFQVVLPMYFLKGNFNKDYLDGW